MTKKIGFLIAIMLLAVSAPAGDTLFFSVSSKMMEGNGRMIRISGLPCSISKEYKVEVDFIPNLPTSDTATIEDTSFSLSQLSDEINCTTELRIDLVKLITQFFEKLNGYQPLDIPPDKCVEFAMDYGVRWRMVKNRTR
jgi:hypothetical protein